MPNFVFTVISSTGSPLPEPFGGADCKISTYAQEEFSKATSQKTLLLDDVIDPSIVRPGLRD